MSMLKERLQVLIGVEQRDRLEREAKLRGTSVAHLVREAIDTRFPSSSGVRRRAADALLAVEPLPDVPEPGELRRELDELRGRHG